jgi:hypothetical protein
LVTFIYIAKNPSISLSESEGELGLIVTSSGKHHEALASERERGTGT